jgi:hypothetical protein
VAYWLSIIVVESMHIHVIKAEGLVVDFRNCPLLAAAVGFFLSLFFFENQHSLIH